jgi:ribosome biogenesis protein BMS1
MEDITDPEVVRRNPKADRRVSLYGYLRGIHLKPDMAVHIPGCGDFLMEDVTFLPDPCALPSSADPTKKKRSLNEKEKLVYAPMSGMTGVVYDKDAVYVEMKKNNAEEDEGEAKQLVGTMQEQMETVDDKLDAAQMKIFSSAAPIVSSQSVPDENGRVEVVVKDPSGRERRKVIFADEDVNSDEEVESDDENDWGEDEEEFKGKPDSESEEEKEDYAFSGRATA